MKFVTFEIWDRGLHKAGFMKFSERLVKELLFHQKTLHRLKDLPRFFTYQQRLKKELKNALLKKSYLNILNLVKLIKPKKIRTAYVNLINSQLCSEKQANMLKCSTYLWILKYKGIYPPNVARKCAKALKHFICFSLWEE